MVANSVGDHFFQVSYGCTFVPILWTQEFCSYQLTKPFEEGKGAVHSRITCETTNVVELFVLASYAGSGAVHSRICNVVELSGLASYANVVELRLLAPKHGPARNSVIFWTFLYPPSAIK